MSFNANLDAAIAAFPAGNVLFENIYVRRDGSAFECTVWYDRFWQSFKDWIRGDSQIDKISDVFEKVAAQYFAQLSAPVTVARNFETKTGHVAAENRRMLFLLRCIEANQDSFDDFASDEAIRLFERYQETKNLPLADEKARIVQLEADLETQKEATRQKEGEVRHYEEDLSAAAILSLQDQEQIRALTGEKNQLDIEKSNLKDNTVLLEKSLKEEEARLADLNQQISDLRASSTKSYEALKDEHEKMKTHCEELLKLGDSKNEENLQLSREIKACEEQVKQLEVNLTNTSEDVKELLREKEIAKSKFQKIITRLRQEKKTNKLLQRELKSIKCLNEARRTEIEGLEQSNSLLKQKNLQYAYAVQGAQATYEELTATTKERDQFKEQAQTLEAENGRQKDKILLMETEYENSFRKAIKQLETDVKGLEKQNREFYLEIENLRLLLRGGDDDTATGTGSEPTNEQIESRIEMKTKRINYLHEEWEREKRVIDELNKKKKKKTNQQYNYA